MNKTLNQLINETSEEAVFGDILDSATNQELLDYFYYRYLCDNDKFIHFFQRNLKIYKKQYVNYLRTENVEFDPMITRYLERQVLNSTENNLTESDSAVSTNTKTGSNTGTINVKTDNIGTGNGTDGVTTNESGTTYLTSDKDNTNTRTGSETTRQRAVNSLFPQANVASATVGMSDNVSMAYASSMTDTNATKTTNESGTDNTDYTENGRTTDQLTSTRNTTDRNVFDGTQVQTNNLSNSSSESKTNDVTKSASDKGSSNLRERLTGRENYDSATLLSHARDYVRETNAFMWLTSKLEKCFIGNLRYGEE